jgi:hypothetical protein
MAAVVYDSFRSARVFLPAAAVAPAKQEEEQRQAYFSSRFRSASCIILPLPNLKSDLA